MKQRLEIRIEEDLRKGIDIVAVRTDQTVTALVERYIREGLARDNGEIVEQSTLPLISETVRREVNQAFSQLYERLTDDMTKVALRDTNRLAALIVKAARYAGIGQRMIYALLARTVSPDFASKAYEDAKEKTGRDIARPDQN